MELGWEQGGLRASLSCAQRLNNERNRLVSCSRERNTDTWLSEYSCVILWPLFGGKVDSIFKAVQPSSVGFQANSCRAKLWCLDKCVNETYGVVRLFPPQSSFIGPQAAAARQQRSVSRRWCHVSVALSSGEASTPMGSWPSRHCLSLGPWKSCSKWVHFTSSLLLLTNLFVFKLISFQRSYILSE